MIKLKTFCLWTFLALTINACGQTKNNHNRLGKIYAEQELKSALNNKAQHNVIDNVNLIIKDSLTAINIVEPILFSIYGKDNIVRQRPYEIFLIDSYWVINGTLPKGYLGGTFLIIIDAKNSKVIRISHGK